MDSVVTHVEGEVWVRRHGAREAGLLKPGYGPRNLDGDLRVDAGDELVVAGLDHLREVELDAGEAFHAAAHRLDQLVFGIIYLTQVTNRQLNNPLAVSINLLKATTQPASSR